MRYRKLKTLVKTKFDSKVTMLDETIEFKNAIIICYGKKKPIALQQIVPKAEVWVIAKAITFILNPIVYASVMNQSKGHWLLSNALTISITLTMEMEAQLLELSIGLEIFYLFEAKIYLLHRNMRLEVIKGLEPFLEFLRSFDVMRPHNMMAIMLDPHFKALSIMANLVGRGNAI